ncbi:MAG: flagellar assembly protein FliH [Tuberibacillus sp.]
MSLSNILKAAQKGETRLIEITPPKISVQMNHQDNLTPEELAKEIIRNAEREAEAIRDSVNRERDAVLKNINLEKEAWIEERELERNHARDEGFKEGYRQGYDEAKAEWDERLSQVHEMIHRAEEDYKKYLEKSEEVVLKLATAIAGRIVSIVLEQNPHAWVELVKSAIQEVRDQETIKIIVAPTRYSQMTDNRDVLQSVSHDARIQIFPDDALKENDCFIETPYGRIDASVDQQLSVIKQTLKEFLEAGSDGNRSTH